MRILLATEGESDEAVAKQLIARQAGGNVQIVAKKFPARGFTVVKRAIPTLVRAAHYSLFDLLVVHFDLDDTLGRTWRSLAESGRWQEVTDEANRALSRLNPVPGRKPLKYVLMAPCQTIEAWVGWGAHGGQGDPTWWERRDRNLLKSELNGGPPHLGVVSKVDALLPNLLARMDATSNWPAMLRAFTDALDTALTPP